MMIRALDEDVRSLLRSGIAVSSVTQCIDELVVNSLDAAATCITVRLDLPEFRLQVSDNGTGISRDNLEILGERYSTSKCHSLTDLNNIKFYGFRGEAVASIRDIAGNLEIVTRHKSSYKTYCKTFKPGKVAEITEACIPRSNVGTTVTVYDIFSTLPVRRKLVTDVLEVERIRQRLSSIALINPGVSFSLYNDTTGQKCLQTRKCQSVVSTFSQLFGILKAKSLHEVKGSADDVKVSGYIGLQTHNSKSLQFVYINGRLVMKTRVHKLVNHALNKSLLIKKPVLSSDNAETGSVTSPPKQTSEKYGIYVLNITCPCTAYDITLEPAKTLVEFEDWEKVLCATRECVESFLMEENLMQTVDVSDDAEESQDSCDSQIDLSVYEYQSDTTKHEYCIDARNIRKSLHSSVVSRKPNTSQTSRENCVLKDCTEIQHKKDVSKASVILQTARENDEKGKTTTPSLRIPGNKTPLSVPGKTLTIASKTNDCCFTSPNPITLKPRRMVRRVHLGSTTKSSQLNAHDERRKKSSADLNIDQSVNTDSKVNNNKIRSNEDVALKDHSSEVGTVKRDSNALTNDHPSDNNSNELFQTAAVDNNVSTATTSCANKAQSDSKLSLVDERDEQEEINSLPISNDTDKLVVDESMSSTPDTSPVTTDVNTSKQVVDKGASTTLIDKCQMIFDRNTVTDCTNVSDNCLDSFDNNTKRLPIDDRISTVSNNSYQVRHKSNMNGVSKTSAESCPVTFNTDTDRHAVDDGVSNVINICPAMTDGSTNSVADKPAETCSNVTDIWQVNLDCNTSSTQLPIAVDDSCSVGFENNTNRQTVDNGASKVTDIWQAMFDSNMNKTVYYNVNTGNTVFECPYNQDINDHDDDSVARDGVSGMVPLVCAPHVSFDCTPWLPRNNRHKKTTYQENKEQCSSYVSTMLDQWVNPVFESTSEMDVTSLCKPTTTRTSLYKAILPYRFTKDMVKDLHVIQQVDNKFIVCQVQQANSDNEHDGLVVLLDQHAVHERIRLEKLTSDLFNTTTQSDSSLPSIKSFPVSPPIEIDFTSNDLLLIKRFRGELGRVGVKFVIGCSSESIESRSIIVHELPCVFVEREVSETRRRRPSVAVSIVKDLIESHIEHLRQTNGVSPVIPKTITRVLSSQACHGAIKFGDSLSVQECQQLIQQLSACDLPFQCAHGRPSIVPLVDLKLLESMHLPLEVVQKPKLSRLNRAANNYQ